ncbi:hypothetical protein Ppa06_15370 [Planomonospora parontospora subsp. parontospora]|uniref:Fimbrial assembly family protein n=2 Tax=Planomonospora parontospora TaxID=58119 RepID=A0AA37BDV4_9ACTN|nr:hypothetical protein [Planomonospora parontospora]GGK57172.1 hypothetical protein GCM10010126_15920 [Planomonospora parontospora]GII07739.1 hypothetical protein Ppa06_15370 [Planomonospora parontospora subsp. parontospora]
MTTTLTPPESGAPVLDPFRPLSIAADLLPPEITAARRGHRARAVVLSALAVFAMLLAGWYVVARQQTAEAEDAVAVAQADVQDLIRQQREFSDLVTVRSQAETIGARLSTLLANDLRWATVLSSVRKAAPAGVELVSVNGKVDERGAEAAGSEQLNTSGEKLVGELSITGTAGGKQAVTEYVDALGGIPGLGNPLLTDVREEESGVGFAVRTDLTEAALGGRYTDPADTADTADTAKKGD